MSQNRPALVMHGHFYQPPRENPWTGAIDRQPGAAPFLHWNERIHAECYRPNAFARVLDGFGRIEHIVNNYVHLNFNFGPTLHSWLAAHHASTAERIVEADRESLRRRGGHGNAIAQAYGHAILPLCNERDRRTHVRWGRIDFRRRFGREPEGMWLPETACDESILDLLIEEGIRFTILAPHQAARVRPVGASEWRDVSDGSVDPSVPYRFFHRDGSGRSLSIFFYDGALARAVAFEGALASSQGLVDHFLRSVHGAGLVHAATDGESYGHHFHFGDRTMAYAMEVEAPRRGFWVTNYGEYLERHPPTMEVRLHDHAMSWSCRHGVDRWMRDCGCQEGAREGWNQAWREPLRNALDFLRDEIARTFEGASGELLLDPWAARDDYVRHLLEPAEDFVSRHASRPLNAEERVRALTLLEIQRHALLMYTSCGWFFADLSGIETLQVLRYAGRAVDLLRELALPAPLDPFLDLLARARSNLAKEGTGADLFRRSCESGRVTPPQVAAHLGISSLIGDVEPQGALAGFRYEQQDHRSEHHGRLQLATSRILLESEAVGRRHDFALAAMYFGGVDFYCVLQPCSDPERFERAAAVVWDSFRSRSLPTLLRLVQEHFGPWEFGLEHVLADGRRRISESVFRNLVQRFSLEYARLHESYRRDVEMLQEAGLELPTELRAAAEFTLGKQFEEAIRAQQRSRDPRAYRRAVEIAEEVARRGYHIDRTAARRLFEEMVLDAVLHTLRHPDSESAAAMADLVELARELRLDPDLERAQEALYPRLHEEAPISDAIRRMAQRLGFSPRLIEAAP